MSPHEPASVDEWRWAASPRLRPDAAGAPGAPGAPKTDASEGTSAPRAVGPESPELQPSQPEHARPVAPHPRPSQTGASQTGPSHGEPLNLPGRDEVERLAAVVRRPAATSMSAQSGESVPSAGDALSAQGPSPRAGSLGGQSHPAGRLIPSEQAESTGPTGSAGAANATDPAGPAVSSFRQTAAEFSEAMVLGRPQRGATTGWRRAFGTLTGGLLTLPPGPAEQRRNQYLSRVRAPIEGTRRIVVMSRKGGVGKTTVTVGVGATFASVRGDRVVAVDANPDAGNLARRIAGDCQRTITDLLADAGRIKSFATMRGYTSQCIESRLEVLASDDDAKIAQALGKSEYDQIVSLLDHYYNLILLDTGTGILDSANQGLIAQADQLVLVVRPALDGARAGAQTLDWLEEHGHADLVSSAVVAINGIDRESDPIVTFSRKHFTERCAHVTTIPWDRALEAGARTTLSNLQRRTRDSFVDVAAALADGFAQPRRKHRLEPAPVPAVPRVAFDEDDPSDDVPAFLL